VFAIKKTTSCGYVINNDQRNARSLLMALLIYKFSP